MLVFFWLFVLHLHQKGAFWFLLLDLSVDPEARLSGLTPAMAMVGTPFRSKKERKPPTYPSGVPRGREVVSSLSFKKGGGCLSWVNNSLLTSGWGGEGVWVPPQCQVPSKWIIGVHGNGPNANRQGLNRLFFSLYVHTESSSLFR